jgi:hypothetical protein
MDRPYPRLAATALASLIALVAPTSATGQADEDELKRYRPILRYSDDEEYFAQPVSLPPRSAEVRRGDRVYGHVALEGNDVWLQYWFFYAYNPQDRNPLNTGRHEGDWELAQFRLGPDGVPDLATLAQHSWAEGCDWNELDLRSGAPVLYVANGSHAVYSAPGSYDRPFPDPTDEADGAGRQVRPRLTAIDDGSPAWVDYEGRWGKTEVGWIPGESPSPRGPRFQENSAWNTPSAFHEDDARECGSGAPGRPWQTPLAAVLVAALVLFGIVRYRRSHPMPSRR